MTLDLCPLLQAKGQDLVQRSVLGPVLPEAMVCYLENYEAERFSEIFLGEFDTPEAIWSSEMRCVCLPVINVFSFECLGVLTAQSGSSYGIVIILQTCVENRMG